MRLSPLLPLATFFCAIATGAFAFDGVSKNAPVMLEARELGYDQEAATVIAIGNVEISQGETIVIADRVVYNQNTNMVNAIGNVSVLQPDGNVYFAQNVVLRDDMSAGVIENFRARLSDNSLFAAREARRISPDVTQLNKAVYSPCKVCEGKSPLWQIKADRVTYDTAAQRIYYRDAFFEVYGVPIAYTPYLSHPTPDADAKTGLMLPEYSTSSSLGTVIKVPLYIAIAGNQDATITPIYASSESPILAGEYHLLTDRGEFRFEGSATNPSRRGDQGQLVAGNDFRGHIRATGYDQMSEHWGWGFNVNRASDDTYLRRYRFGFDDLLTSRIFTERVAHRSYFGLEGLAYQGLRVEDDPDTSPVIVPMFDMAVESDPLLLGSRLSLASNLMSLSRSLGNDVTRGSATLGWRLPFVTAGGQFFEAKASLRADHYDVNDLTLSDGSQFDGKETRVIPQAELHWRYPFINRTQGTTFIVEPVASAIISDNGHNPEHIPNEDSLSPEFAEDNLFSDNRYPGMDRVETGTRVHYGLRGLMQFADDRNVSLLIGQGYRFDVENPFPFTNDASSHFSDYVGRLGVRWGPFDAAYRFRFDQNDFASRRHDVVARINMNKFQFSSNFTSLVNDPIYANREEIGANMAMGLSDNWTFVAGARRDLDEGAMVSGDAGLIFRNECVTVTSIFRREFIRDRDIEPDTSFSVRVALKNLE